MLYQYLLAIGGIALLLSIWVMISRVNGVTRIAAGSRTGPAAASLKCSACGLSENCPTKDRGL